MRIVGYIGEKSGCSRIAERSVQIRNIVGMTLPSIPFIMIRFTPSGKGSWRDSEKGGEG